MMFRSKRVELVSGLRETLALVRQLWPSEADSFGGMSVSDAVEWLNQKTGLTVTGTSAGHFGHWLPKLRTMADVQP